MSTVTEIKVSDLSPLQREVNKSLMVAWINADLLNRASCDVRKSVVLYDADTRFTMSPTRRCASAVRQHDGPLLVEGRRLMAAGWMCTCSHNASVHRRDWNKLRGQWDTSCTHVEWVGPVERRCRCLAFDAVDADPTNVDTRPFGLDDYTRGYVCVAPNRTCGVLRTVNMLGVWFKNDGGQLWQSANEGCLQAAKEEE